MAAPGGDISDHACDAATAPCANRQRCVQTRWLIGGAVFGALFPIVGWLVATADSAAAGLASAHRTQPVLYIVDVAPLVLGVTGFVIGHFHARLLKTRHSIEQTVHRRTAELEQALAHLSAVQTEKDRFIASVSHELRTPLTSVVGLAQTLIEPDTEISPGEQSELLGLISSESKEVAAIVEDLLVAARVENGHLSIAADELRLDEELCRMIEVCKVDVDPTRIEEVTAVGDAVRIHQIVRNLITNADRYGGEKVIVEVYAEGDIAVLAVKDNGTGVPDGHLDRIFSPFGTAHDDPGRTESIGLGLTVSRKLARLMGGEVLYSRDDGWTSFELHLPLMQEHHQDNPGAIAGHPEGVLL